MFLGDAVRAHFRVTVENRNPRETRECFHQINYTLTDVPDDAAYFHAQFRRVNPTAVRKGLCDPGRNQGKGHYVGTTLGVGVNNSGCGAKAK